MVITNNQGIKYNIKSREDILDWFETEGFNKYDIDKITSFSEVEINYILKGLETGWGNPDYAINDMSGTDFALLFLEKDKLNELCKACGITDGLEGFYRRSGIQEIVFSL